MKKILLLIAIEYSQVCFSQISITSGDMPSAGDTARRTQAPLTLGLNYQASGANHTWNFSNLRYQSQQVDTFYSVSSTNFLYALFFSNLPFNPNRANVATTGQAFPSNPFITITDPYNFYYRSSAAYEQVGLGASFQGIPLPVAFTQKDKIYQFPLSFGDVDTSYSSWNASLPGMIYYGSSLTRINQVDGWGTLNTPYGTYQALRVKSTLLASDTLYLDSLSIGMQINRPVTHEYKWLVNGEIVPALQITTTEVFGIEIISSILFRDVVPAITTAALPVAICAGSSFQVPFTEFGTFNSGTLFSPGNVFTAQLSDANGDFSNAITIGDSTTNQSGNFGVNIPAGTPAGNGYRIRIISSNPAVIGSDNGTDIRIDNGLPAASIIAAGSQGPFCWGDSTELNGSQVNDVSYQWMLNAVALSGANALSHFANQPGDYTLNTINACGVSSSNTISIVFDSLPQNAVIASTGNTTFCEGDSVLLNAGMFSGVTYQWQQNGVDIPGALSTALSVSQTGTYTLNTINHCGTSSSNSIQVNAHPLPPLPVISASNDTLFTTGGFSYIWYLNGNVIPGAVDSFLVVNTSGQYEVGITNIDSCSSLSNPYNYISTGMNGGIGGSGIRLFPNPVRDLLSLQLAERGEYVIEILSAEGKKVSGPHLFSGSGIQIMLPASLESGIYFIRIQNEFTSLTQRFVLSR